MELSEDQVIQKHAKHCGYCKRNALLPYEYEWTCFSCGSNVIKRKNELSKLQRKNVNFINRIKYAQQKVSYFCVDVYKSYEGNDFDKIYEVLST